MQRHVVVKVDNKVATHTHWKSRSRLLSTCQCTITCDCLLACIQTQWLLFLFTCFNGWIRFVLIQFLIYFQLLHIPFGTPFFCMHYTNLKFTITVRTVPIWFPALVLDWNTWVFQLFMVFWGFITADSLIFTLALRNLLFICTFFHLQLFWLQFLFF